SVDRDDGIELLSDRKVIRQDLQLLRLLVCPYREVEHAYLLRRISGMVLQQALQQIVLLRGERHGAGHRPAEDADDEFVGRALDDWKVAASRVALDVAPILDKEMVVEVESIAAGGPGPCSIEITEVGMQDRSEVAGAERFLRRGIFSGRLRP